MNREKLLTLINGRSLNMDAFSFLLSLRIKMGSPSDGSEAISSFALNGFSLGDRDFSFFVFFFFLNNFQKKKKKLKPLF